MNKIDQFYESIPSKLKGNNAIKSLLKIETKNKIVSFDCEKWLKYYNIYTDFKNNTFSNGGIRGLNRYVLHTTIYTCRNRKFEYFDDCANSTITMEMDEKDLINSSVQTKYYDNVDNVKEKVNLNKKVDVKIIDGDCVECAINMKKLFKVDDVGLLNMASSTTPGGGYKGGSNAQEENLHRRSNLCMCLEDIDKVDKNRKWKYPIKTFGGIFSPDVLFFRGSQMCGYKFIKPEKLAVLTVAAVRRPDLILKSETSEYYMKKDGEETTKGKIRTMLKIAMDNKIKNLVLSAFGCGAFKNPAHHVAKLFKEILNEDEFVFAFERVYFSIYNDHNAISKVNPEGNLLPFEKVFNTKSIKCEEMKDLA